MVLPDWQLVEMLRNEIQERDARGEVSSVGLHARAVEGH